MERYRETGKLQGVVEVAVSILYSAFLVELFSINWSDMNLLCYLDTLKAILRRKKTSNDPALLMLEVTIKGTNTFFFNITFSFHSFYMQKAIRDYFIKAAQVITM